jgi:hypothetical protein
MGLNTKAKRKECGLHQLILGTNTNALAMIATKEDWENDINGRVA